MSHKIKRIEAKENLILRAMFFDGTIKEYDVKKMVSPCPQFKELKDVQLFKSVQVDTGGYGISWNENLDLDSETIWEDGVTTEVKNADPNLEFAFHLSEARNLMGITQKQLAEKTGIYQADISKIERGLGNPSLNTMKRLADGLGMDLKIFFQKKQ